MPGAGQFGERDLLSQAGQYLECAARYPLNFRIPKVSTFSSYAQLPHPQGKYILFVCSTSASPRYILLARSTFASPRQVHPLGILNFRNPKVGTSSGYSQLPHPQEGAVAHYVRQLATKSKVRGSNPSPGPANIAFLRCVNSALKWVARSVKTPVKVMAVRKVMANYLVMSYAKNNQTLLLVPRCLDKVWDPFYSFYYSYKVHFAFYNQVTEPMAAALERLGVCVWGQRVPVDPVVLTKLEAFGSGDSSEESDSSCADNSAGEERSPAGTSRNLCADNSAEEERCPAGMSRNLCADNSAGEERSPAGMSRNLCEDNWAGEERSPAGMSRNLCEDNSAGEERCPAGMSRKDNSAGEERSPAGVNRDYTAAAAEGSMEISLVPSVLGHEPLGRSLPGLPHLRLTESGTAAWCPDDRAVAGRHGDGGKSFRVLVAGYEDLVTSSEGGSPADLGMGNASSRVHDNKTNKRPQEGSTLCREQPLDDSSSLACCDRSGNLCVQEDSIGRRDSQRDKDQSGQDISVKDHSRDSMSQAHTLQSPKESPQGSCKYIKHSLLLFNQVETPLDSLLTAGNKDLFLELVSSPPDYSHFIDRPHLSAGSDKTSLPSNSSSSSLATEPATSASWSASCEELSSIQRVNLDITSLIALVSSVTNGQCHLVFRDQVLTTQAKEEREAPVLPVLKRFLEGKSPHASSRIVMISSVTNGQCHLVFRDQVLTTQG
ncbi:LOW QUALITY PROTEIN: upf0415 protein c7orf25-like protein [Plakobranchus ocellatus]|uniref:Upf0415 protein c7orf25-like protein n=1 Tax=Plakobranchus ocellatus TaxID=259542 RepID=A0AAV4DQL4_9GAST|nr:LOW QUALITY PROTEIN: upf0415 protein c7orf25-like protein [Plakobranchus ocellatus]